MTKKRGVLRYNGPGESWVVASRIFSSLPFAAIFIAASVSALMREWLV